MLTIINALKHLEPFRSFVVSECKEEMNILSFCSIFLNNFVSTKQQQTKYKRESIDRGDSIRLMSRLAGGPDAKSLCRKLTSRWYKIFEQFLMSASF